MKEIIKQIVHNGILGPSPFNIQAVKYTFNNERKILDVYLDEDRAHMSSLTSEHTFKEHCIGIGGSVENIKISASELGYKAEIEYCPQNNNRYHLARVKFIKSEPIPEDLFSYIVKSWSSRDPMTKKDISNTDLEKISEITQKYNEFFRIEFITQKKHCLKIAKLSAKAETMNWSLKPTQSKHRSFLKFSQKSMDAKNDGIGIWEFGMPKVIGPVAKVFTNWSVYKWLLPFGIAQYVGWSARLKKGKTVRTFLVFVLKESEDIKKWLIGGELMQKVFLETTKQGIDHQWYSSMYIWDDVVNGLGDINQLNAKYQKKANELSMELRELIPIKNDFVLASIALGYTGKLANPKYRRSVEQVLTYQN